MNFLCIKRFKECVAHAQSVTDSQKKKGKKKKKNSEKLSLYEKIKKGASRTENRRKFKETLIA